MRDDDVSGDIRSRSSSYFAEFCYFLRKYYLFDVRYLLSELYLEMSLFGNQATKINFRDNKSCVQKQPSPWIPFPRDLA